ncbi:hypothetical protein FQ087_06085 [Sporosarcina sp. ANT_H38]|uniref:hypothetical protein n=1 Tax=Sporosarcina sp. ANT_H38 TaxID=2597358 RepID=UPI0011F38C33|nr:hypothetical protein [Sporosarcina sp. ANT_H38]KAA0965834.1 hypothetical protein FQ087_06085 [Sporosarcina sp. ANT_H38]
MKIMRQIGGTCGYYAFINSLSVLFPEVQFSHKDVYLLLEKSLSMKLTHVGEMFDYPPTDFFEEHFEDRGLLIHLENRKIDNLIGDMELLEEEEAIIISIASGKKSSHWIGVVKVDGKLLTLNSMNRSPKKYNYKNLEKKHNKLENRVYNFKTYFKLSKKIRRIPERFFYNNVEKKRYKDKYSDMMLKLVRELEDATSKGIPEEIKIEYGSYYFLKKIAK